MQMEIRKRHRARDRVHGRGGTVTTEAHRLFPPDGVRQRPVIVVGAGEAAGAADGDRWDGVAARVKVHGTRARFQGNARRVEGRSRGTDYGHCLAAQRRKIDDIGGMGAERRGQRFHRRWIIRPAIAADAVRQHHLASRFDPGVQMQAEMISHRFDPVQADAVTDLDPQELLVPGQVCRPIHTPDTVDRGIGLPPVTGFVPRLKTQCRQAQFRPDQRFRGAQQVHAGGIQPHARLRLIRRRIDHRDLADPRPPQRPGEGAAGLTAAHQHDIVVDPRTVQHPIPGRRADQPQRLMGAGVRVLGHRPAATRWARRNDRTWRTTTGIISGGSFHG